MSMKVRRAEEKDLQLLVALHDEVHALHLAARPDQFKPAADGALDARFRELLAASDHKVWVAELHDRVVGYAVQQLRHRAELAVVRELRWWDIDMLAVTAQHRRQGIGRALIQAVIDDARASGIPDVELGSWAFNTDAHRAFQRAGFVPKFIRFELKR